MRRRVIHDPETGEPYLIRWFILPTRWFGVKLHRILRHDYGRDLHDHPWWFVSIVLWGWYEEEVVASSSHTIGPRSDGTGCCKYEQTTRIRRIRWLNFKRPEGQHRIVAVSPRCWTFVINGPHVRTWGFHTAQGFVPWFTYFNKRAS